MNLLIAGTIGLDTIETPFARAENVLGGSAVYASLAAGLFTQPGMVSIAGTDFTSEHASVLEKRAVDIGGVTITNGKTFRWGGRYDFDLNNRTTLFTELNSLAEFNPLLPEEYKPAPYVFLGNVAPALQMQILQQLSAPTFIALDTMNYWMEHAWNDLQALLPCVDALIINDAEARELSKEFNINKAAKKILNMMSAASASEKNTKTPLLIIKRGEYGLQMFQGSDIFSLPAFPLEEVFDPTGAGDSFAGAFMGYLAANGSENWEALKRACVAGSVLASFCVEHMGVQGLLDIDETKIKNRLAEFKRLTEFDLNID